MRTERDALTRLRRRGRTEEVSASGDNDMQTNRMLSQAAGSSGVGDLSRRPAAVESIFPRGARGLSSRRGNGAPRPARKVEAMPQQRETTSMDRGGFAGDAVAAGLLAAVTGGVPS